MITDKYLSLLQKYSDDIIDKDTYESVDRRYPVKLSNHITNLLKNEYTPEIAKQFLPSEKEIEDTNGLGAFFSDEKEVSKRTYQKYPNRCIIYTTSNCFAHCRFCSRKEKWHEKIEYSKTDFDYALSKLRNSSKIEEVILTGGDSLTLSNEDLDYMIGALSKISHIKIIRLGTRAFSLNPQRINKSLCDMIKKYSNIVICTQFNHPSEFTSESIKALRNVQRTGTPILNQSVLLKGINDDIQTMRQLLTACTTNRVIPYYLFHCFKVKGAQHFRTHPLLGKQILDRLIGEIGGWWIPRYILIPESTGVKVPLCHYGVIKNNDDELILKDFKDRQIKYN